MASGHPGVAAAAAAQPPLLASTCTPRACAATVAWSLLADGTCPAALAPRVFRLDQTSRGWARGGHNGKRDDSPLPPQQALGTTPRRGGPLGHGSCAARYARRRGSASRRSSGWRDTSEACAAAGAALCASCRRVTPRVHLVRMSRRPRLQMKYAVWSRCNERGRRANRVWCGTPQTVSRQAGVERSRPCTLQARRAEGTPTPCRPSVHTRSAGPCIGATQTRLLGTPAWAGRPGCVVPIGSWGFFVQECNLCACVRVAQARWRLGASSLSAKQTNRVRRAEMATKNTVDLRADNSVCS